LLLRRVGGCSVREGPSVSPGDNAGCFSFGTANGFTSTAACHGRKRVVDLSENKPRVEATVAIARPDFREAEKLYLV